MTYRYHGRPEKRRCTSASLPHYLRLGDRQHQRRQASRACGMRSSPASAPISAAKRPAPSPTRNSCGSRSSTCRATLTGWRNPFSAPTAPVRSIVPSMTDASSSTSPKRFGQPPRPTVRTFSSSSTSRIPASTASRAVAPSAIRRAVTGMPEVPSLLVTTIIAAVLVLQVAVRPIELLLHCPFWGSRDARLCDRDGRKADLIVAWVRLPFLTDAVEK